MKAFLLACSFMIVYATIATGQTTKNAQSIDLSLRKIYQMDQSVRRDLISHFQTGNVDSIIFYSMKKEEVDLENQQFVFNLLDTEGWPSNISDSAHKAIFLVIDHAELPDQKKYLPVMMEQTANRFIKKSDLATLQDRILMYENKKQIYGTQTKIASRIVGDNKIMLAYLWPIETPASIDSLRATVGLYPIAEYIEFFKQNQGIDLIWDASLTPDDVNLKLSELK